MAKGKRGKKDAAAIVIRREEVVEGAHHSGAWKVAYADFVTAMMAFFLLMWLINATSDKQRRGIADYFSPEGQHARSLSGSGKPFGGTTPFEKGALVSNLGSVSVTNRLAHADGAVGGDEDPDAVDPPPAPPPSPAAGPSTGAAAGKIHAGDAIAPASPSDPDAVPINGTSHLDGDAGRGTASTNDGDAGDPTPVRRAPPADKPAAAPAAAASPAVAASPALVPVAFDEGSSAARAPREADPAMAAVAKRLREAVSRDPALAGIRDQMSVAVTPDGLRIQIVDTERSPMFDDGSAVPNSRARLLLATVAPVLAALGDPVSITGHTDNTGRLGNGTRSNWSLSAARADATRMVLEAGGLPDGRITGVTGVADREPLAAADPGAAENRRVVMIVRRSASQAVSAGAGPGFAAASAGTGPGRSR